MGRKPACSATACRFFVCLPHLNVVRIKCCVLVCLLVCFYSTFQASCSWSVVLTTGWTYFVLWNYHFLMELSSCRTVNSLLLFIFILFYGPIFNFWKRCKTRLIVKTLSFVILALQPSRHVSFSLQNVPQRLCWSCVAAVSGTPTLQLH